MSSSRRRRREEGPQARGAAERARPRPAGSRRGCPPASHGAAKRPLLSTSSHTYWDMSETSRRRGGNVEVASPPASGSEKPACQHWGDSGEGLRWGGSATTVV